MSKMIYIVEEWEADAGGEFLDIYCFDTRPEAEWFKTRMEEFYGPTTSQWLIKDKLLFTDMHDAVKVWAGVDDE